MHRLRIAILGILTAFAAVGCARPSAERADRAEAGRAATSGVTVLGVAGAANAGAGIAASGHEVVVVWAASRHDTTNVYAAASRDGGATFGPLVRVNDLDGDARISGDQAPRVAIGRDVVVAWESKFAGESRIRLARSRDGGRTFGPAGTAHAESLPGARGWASMAFDRTGALQVAWLDGREAHHDALAAAGKTGTEPAAEMHHAMEQDLFHLTWRPDGTRVETRIARNVCFCCKTSVAAAPDGTIYVAWRHIYPTNLRDIAVARSTDGGRNWNDPVRVSEDHWRIDGCPEDGPSIAVDVRGVLQVAWPTLIADRTDRKAIFHSDSTDGGRTFRPRARIDTGDADVRTAAHPQLAADGTRAVVTWEEVTAHGHRVMWRGIGPTGGTMTPATMLTDDGLPSYPAIATTAEGLVVAWTAKSVAGSEIHVQRVARGW